MALDVLSKLAITTWASLLVTSACITPDKPHPILLCRPWATHFIPTTTSDKASNLAASSSSYMPMEGL